ncbi:MAG: cytochrome c oxidase subunit II, partial [bacterium]|nr:cytochrome c oxidase subunit II [bacterium]
RGRTKTTTQFEGHKWLEITWIVVPTVIVTWMFFVGYRGFIMMREVPEDAMVVKVTGRQWMWAFHYPDAKIDTTEMTVPVNTPVKVELTAPLNDVIHSFFIPDFRVKEDVLPGKDTHLWFEAERVGTFHILCAEFCGKDHSQMIAMLKVVPQAEFDQWVKDQQNRKYQPLVYEAFVDPRHETFGENGLNIDASSLYLTFCKSCHGVNGDGSGLPDSARDFRVADRWKRSPKATDIFRTLTEGIENTQMRAYANLAPWERAALAHAVRAFFTGELPKDAPEDYAALVEQYGLDKVQKPTETIPIDRAMEIMVEEAETSGSEKTREAPG